MRSVNRRSCTFLLATREAGSWLAPLAWLDGPLDRAVAPRYATGKPENRHRAPREAQMADALERTAIRKVYARLLPITLLIYFLCYVDRINVGFAALTMNKEL